MDNDDFVVAAVEIRALNKMAAVGLLPVFDDRDAFSAAPAARQVMSCGITLKDIGDARDALGQIALQFAQDTLKASFKRPAVIQFEVSHESGDEGGSLRSLTFTLSGEGVGIAFSPGVDEAEDFVSRLHADEAVALLALLGVSADPAAVAAQLEAGEGDLLECLVEKLQAVVTACDYIGNGCEDTHSIEVGG